MREADYRALTAACDNLLRAPAATSERIAVSWLHVLSEHPNNLRQYEAVFEPRRQITQAKETTRRWAGIGRALLRSLLKSGSSPATMTGPLRGKVDVLFISHYVSATQTVPENTDFYYGDLSRELESRGITPFTLLLNHTSVQDTSVHSVGRGDLMSRLVLPLSLSFHEEVDMVRRAKLAASVLLNDAAAARTAFEGAVATEAARHAISGATITSLRLHYVVKRLCAQLSPRAVVVTWEGHAWERLVFHAARTLDPNVRCIGYQHTVLFPRSHALRRSLGADYDPDVILTMGDVNRDVLRQADGLRGIPIITYGSHRHAAAPKPRADDASTRCLVIPEGLELECLTLFEFAVRAAASLPNTAFVLRAHPVLPFQQLARRHRHFRDLPSNVHVSDEADIAADFARCDWALYRGSSAAVHAVLAGVRPVYVQREGELSIDPLFAMRGWRRHVATAEELDHLVRTDQAMRSEHRQTEWAPARAFCERYVVPSNPEIVYELLSG